MAQQSPRPNALLSLLSEAGIEYTCKHSTLELRFNGLHDDARDVEPGDVFVAVPGTLHDGHAFIAQAIDSGAVAVVLDDPRRVDSRVPCLLVRDTRKALAQLSAMLSGLAALQSADAMTVLGITGTNGKSTSCHLIRDILQMAGHPCAILGTIGYDLVGRDLAAPWTTPPAPRLAELLVESHGHGARYAVMEVSSHALDQRRTDGVRFAVAVFTNLTGDHLDYHADMDDYARSKKRLFDGLAAQSTAVINADDARSAEMVADCRAKILRFGLSSGADVSAVDISCDIQESRFVLRAQGQRLPMSLPLVGRHNISNSLAAAAAALALDIDLPTIRSALNNATTVPGRLQRAEPPGHGFCVFVDYAHTDDALRNVLSALRPLTGGRLRCVFGCGGDRDRTKRPRMAAVCARLADDIVVTSDNPRTEDPAKIIQDILGGFNGRLQQVRVEPDRRRAIQLALREAGEHDVVLIAGKGHEDYQLIGDRRIHFDDLEVVREQLSNPALACQET